VSQCWFHEEARLPEQGQWHDLERFARSEHSEARAAKSSPKSASGVISILPKAGVQRSEATQKI